MISDRPQNALAKIFLTIHLGPFEKVILMRRFDTGPHNFATNEQCQLAMCDKNGLSTGSINLTLDLGRTQ
jgi:hypothetical protein